MATQKMVDEWVAQDRADLAEGRVRVVNFCYACPFVENDKSGAKEKSGNPKVFCKHPATTVPPEPLDVEIGEHGLIPSECPLRVRPTTVFLDPIEEH
jgi:hypothetical protein